MTKTCNSVVALLQAVTTCYHNLLLGCCYHNVVTTAIVYLYSTRPDATRTSTSDIFLFCKQQDKVTTSSTGWYHKMKYLYFQIVFKTLCQNIVNDSKDKRTSWHVTISKSVGKYSTVRKIWIT